MMGQEHHPNPCAPTASCTGDEAMTKRDEPRDPDQVWRAAGELQILPAGDVVVREPREGWSLAFYTAVLR
jgi:hypothetical protein